MSTDNKPAFLPFALPEIGEEEIAEVVDTLRSGWVTTGPKTRRFEEDFAAYLGAPGLHALAVNSATAGLHLALEALGIGATGGVQQNSAVATDPYPVDQHRVDVRGDSGIRQRIPPVHAVGDLGYQ